MAVSTEIQSESDRVESYPEVEFTFHRTKDGLVVFNEFGDVAAWVRRNGDVDLTSESWMLDHLRCFVAAVDAELAKIEDSHDV